MSQSDWLKRQLVHELMNPDWLTRQLADEPNKDSAGAINSPTKTTGATVPTQTVTMDLENFRAVVVKKYVMYFVRLLLFHLHILTF